MLSLESKGVSKINDSFYRCEHGYFMVEGENLEWVFIPHEKAFNEKVIVFIFEILRLLNEERVANERCT